jgi:DNA polymerase-4
MKHFSTCAAARGCSARRRSGCQIKERIRAETGLIASVGVAPNKFLAKLASDHGKPDGFVILPQDHVEAFLAPLPVGRIWGVGRKAEQRLHALGIQTIGQLVRLPEHLLVDHFGAMGRPMARLARGQDERPVVPDREAKSISTETTFAEDIGDREILRTCLLELTEHLASRLRQAGLRARTVEVKIRSSEFKTRHRAQALKDPTDCTEVIWQAVRAVFERSLGRDLLLVRLLGVGATWLTRDVTAQGDLFDGGQGKRQSELDRTIDSIRSQFGNGAIRRGSLIDKKDE